MDEEIIRNEMRLFALETITCQLWAMTLLQQSPDIAAKIHAAWIGGAENQVFPAWMMRRFLTYMLRSLKPQCSALWKCKNTI